MFIFISNREAEFINEIASSIPSIKQLGAEIVLNLLEEEFFDDIDDIRYTLGIIFNAINDRVVEALECVSDKVSVETVCSGSVYNEFVEITSAVEDAMIIKHNIELLLLNIDCINDAYITMMKSR